MSEQQVISRRDARRLIRQKRREIGVHTKRKGEIENELARLAKAKTVYSAIIDLDASAPIFFERIAASRVNALLEAARIGHVGDAPYITDKMLDDVSYLDTKNAFDEAEIFICDHEFGVFIVNKDELEQADWLLPYDECAFEFRFRHNKNVFHIICLAREVDGAKRYSFFVNLQTPGENIWIKTYDHGHDGTVIERAEEKWLTLPFGPTVVKEIRAICVLMDCDVVEKEQVRADYKLNDARKKRGKLPLYEHYTLKLRRASRYIGPALNNEEPRPGPRLHLRRGHWRHYSTFKTWVRWCVVGDASRGFVDTAYRP